MVDKETAEKIFREYLTEKAGLSEKQAEKILKGTRQNVKEALKEQKEEAKAEESKVRHGTSCIGIVNSKKTLAEW